MAFCLTNSDLCQFHLYLPSTAYWPFQVRETPRGRQGQTAGTARGRKEVGEVKIPIWMACLCKATTQVAWDAGNPIVRPRLTQSGFWEQHAATRCRALFGIHCSYSWWRAYSIHPLKRETVSTQDLTTQTKTNSRQLYHWEPIHSWEASTVSAYNNVSKISVTALFWKWLRIDRSEPAC